MFVCFLYLLSSYCVFIMYFFFFKQKTAYEMRISDWSSDVCSSDLPALAVAASLLVAVGLMFRHQLLPDNVPAIRYATVLGEQRSVTLKDGSQVILDTASELLVQYGSRERKLTLHRGRADFSVQHDADAQRPFVVHAATGTVPATGTQFPVRVESGIGPVTLLEGQAIGRASCRERVCQSV